MAGPIALLNTAHLECCNVRAVMGEEIVKLVEGKMKEEALWLKFISEYPLFQNRDWGVIIAERTIEENKYLTLDYGHDAITKLNSFRCPARDCRYRANAAAKCKGKGKKRKRVY
mgnify:CR=1 FL=1|tara:strand:+ start:1960 stop:2301 length:342 start_codon:yes stop_codon:yes gene_type:complete